MRKRTEMKAAEFNTATQKAIRAAVAGTGKCLQLPVEEKAASPAAAFFAKAAVEAVRQGFDVAPDGGTILTNRAAREAALIIEPTKWVRNSKGNVVALREGKDKGKAATKAALQAACFAALAAKHHGHVPVDFCGRVTAANKAELAALLEDLSK